MEFRIYCEDVEGCPIGIVTQGVLNLFAHLYDNTPREAGPFAILSGYRGGLRDGRSR